MRIKVLPLDAWMRSQRSLDSCLSAGQYKPVPVRFGRPGIFLVGAECWFELSDGRAFSYDAEMVRSSLALESARRLNVRQVAALREICVHRLATAQQRALFRCWQEVQELRAIARCGLAAKRRLHKLKAQAKLGQPGIPGLLGKSRTFKDGPK